MSEKQKPSMKERIRRALDIPPDAIFRDSMIEIRGRGMITVHGCERIARYLPGEIRIVSAGGGILILGESLICVSFCAGSVGIEGRVHSVAFLEEGEI